LSVFIATLALIVELENQEKGLLSLSKIVNLSNIFNEALPMGEYEFWAQCMLVLCDSLIPNNKNLSSYNKENMEKSLESPMVTISPFLIEKLENINKEHTQ
jgi:hypothetical protein